MKRKTLRNLAEALRDEMYLRDNISEVLEDGPKTIPEIAGELDFPPYEVTMWLMAMRRYGRVEELPKGRADDYYHYKLIEEKHDES
jgi:predicted Rossmann fold nucleotide-binding protein DprA/Smf involved in DNA uptake